MIHRIRGTSRSRVRGPNWKAKILFNVWHLNRPNDRMVTKEAPPPAARYTPIILFRRVLRRARRAFEAIADKGKYSLRFDFDKTKGFRFTLVLPGTAEMNALAIEMRSIM